MGLTSGEWITLATEGTRHLDAFVAQPASGRGPGVVILHDMFGANASFLELARAHADRGRVAVVANLFWRSQPDGVLPYDEPHDAAWARERAFDVEAAVGDVATAVAWLRRARDCSGKVAVMGFCFSGRLAFRCAARTDIDAAIAFYALGIAQDAGEAGRIACPVELHYGLADVHVPQREIDAVAAGVAGNRNVAIHLYPGAGHSFFNPVRPTYDGSAAALADRRVEALLARLS
jgi:carboxymethylenebutenolidase